MSVDAATSLPRISMSAAPAAWLCSLHSPFSPSLQVPSSGLGAAWQRCIGQAEGGSREADAARAPTQRVQLATDRAARPAPLTLDRALAVDRLQGVLLAAAQPVLQAGRRQGWATCSTARPRARLLRAHAANRRRREQLAPQACAPGGSGRPSVP